MTAKSIVAHPHAFAGGVDTHARKHVYAILAAKTGGLIDTGWFPRAMPTSAAPSPGWPAAPAPTSPRSG